MRSQKPTFFHPYPKYLQIADILRNRLLTALGPGERIPSEIELSQQFGVSRETIRQALAPLEREGLLTRTRGRGSYVARNLPAHQPKKKLTGLAEDFPDDLTYRIISKDYVQGDKEAVLFLGVDRDAHVVRIDRVSTVKDKPLAYHVAFLPASIGTRVLEEDLEHNSIASLLAERCGFPLEEDRQIIEAENADTRLAEYLGLPLGSPILLMRRIYIFQSDLPIAYFRSAYRADRYAYTVVLRQGNKATAAGGNRSRSPAKAGAAHRSRRKNQRSTPPWSVTTGRPR
jgi:GntR family transcriptional regulator